MDHHTAAMEDTATRATTDTPITGTSVACTEAIGIKYNPLEKNSHIPLSLALSEVLIFGSSFLASTLNPKT